MLHMFQKIKIFCRYKKKVSEPEKTKRNLEQIIAFSSISSLPIYLDSNGMCYKLDILLSDKSENFMLESFYKTKLPSFESFEKTNKILLNSKDFKKLIISHQSYINDVSEMTGRSREQVMLDFAKYHHNREFVIQATGISGLIHKVTNTAYVTGSAMQSVVATATSHISGVTGTSFIGATPSLVIFVPLLGGIFFSALERVTANTPIQPICIVARDVCLIPPKIFEIAYNEILIGPVLRVLGIDVPLNVTSMLKFGKGTQTIMGSLVNATIASIHAALPNSLLK